MLTIRMRRVGAKKKPRFRLVVTEARSAPDGAAMEVIGHYNPTSEPETIELDRQRLQHWLDRGAQLTDTVRTLVARHPEAAVIDADTDAAAVEAPAAAEPPPTAEASAAVEPPPTPEAAATAEAPTAESPAATETPATAEAPATIEPEASDGTAPEVEAS